MDMCTAFARHRPYNQFCAGFLIALFCCLASGGQGTHAAPSERLYLLAGTTTQHSDDSYPVRLYRVGKQQKLELAREVVSQTDGIRFVYAWGDAIYALYPHNSATKASIIHTDDPMQADDVTFTRQDVSPVASATTMAAPPGSALILLVPWITNMPDPFHPPEYFDATVAKISSALAGPGPRVQFDTWFDYIHLRREGAYGGPNYVPDLIGSITEDKIAIRFFGHSTAIDRLPPGLRGSSTKFVPVIFAASRDYLIFTPQYSRQEMSSGRLGDSLRLHVHDRSNDRWNVVQSRGNSPTLRLFGAWLTTIVGDWSINHEQPNPGRENERPEGRKTDRLPPTQTLYRSFKGHNILLPGILAMQNLADGRNIRIETGQEDSEILQVRDNLVLYRVNDTIYQAKIDGVQLNDTTIVVKDEDVPEIHWAFWSKGTN